MSAIKSAQLGMSFGTASHRLRKSIMFSMMVRLGGNSCFKCRNKIADVSELSIEHKIPWQGKDNSLFWDLSNIAFSHLACNRPEFYNYTPGMIASSLARRTRLDMLTESGSAWCSGHQKHLPIGRFSDNANKRNGKQDICRECRSKYRSSRNGGRVV